MTQVDRIRDMDAGAHEARVLRGVEEALSGLPVRTPWAYEGRVFLPVAKANLKRFFSCVSGVEFFRNWTKAKEGFDSVVFVSRRVLNPVVSLKRMDYENSLATKGMVESHFVRIQGLLAQYPALGLTEREEKMMKLELMLGDEERMELEDELDFEGGVKCRPGKPVEGITYHDDFYQPDRDINAIITEAQWNRVCPNGSMKLDDD